MSESASTEGVSERVRSVRAKGFYELCEGIESVAAVMFGGVLRVNMGSTITLSGIMERWRRLTFTLASGIAITAFRVTSAPVPRWWEWRS